MNYYKVVLGDKVVDVLEAPVWVRRSPRGRIVICSTNNALGVVSSDSETIWHIAGTDPIDEALEDVKVVDIGEEEAKELQALLGLGGDVTDTDTGVQTEFPQEPEEPQEIPEDATLAEVKRICLERLSAACQQAIFAGVDVEVDEGIVKHFDLEIEDQVNLLSLSALMANGETVVPYHASGELCEFYTAEQMTKIITAATKLKTYHTTYFNSLKNWVLSMQTVSEVYAVQYGDQIPEAYRSDILKQMTVGDDVEVSA